MFSIRKFNDQKESTYVMDLTFVKIGKLKIILGFSMLVSCHEGLIQNNTDKIKTEIQPEFIISPAQNKDSIIIRVINNSEDDILLPVAKHNVLTFEEMDYLINENGKTEWNYVVASYFIEDKVLVKKGNYFDCQFKKFNTPNIDSLIFNFTFYQSTEPNLAISKRFQYHRENDKLIYDGWMDKKPELKDLDSLNY